MDFGIKNNEVIGIGAEPETGIVSAEAVPEQRVNEESVRVAMETLKKYRDGKKHLENRVLSAERWWRLRHWEEANHGNPNDDKPVSAWLFNVIMGKHADAVAAFPTPNILPREQGDKGEARKLSKITPVVLKRNNFDQVYSDNQWRKLKHGTAVYGCYWNKNMLNGLGDIDIRAVDLLNIFWEPGISDIQESRNVFTTALVDVDVLKETYPQFADRFQAGGEVVVSRYDNDEANTLNDKCTVIDWYYKRLINNKSVLHYCKFVGTTVLYASENDPSLSERGWYDDGEYPFVFDALFPIENSPCGYSYIDIGKSAQDTIDQLNQAITKNAVMGSTPRYFSLGNGSVNEAEFADFTKPFVHVTGGSSLDNLIKPIQTKNLDGIYVTILNNKIEELKYTSGNMDVVNGGTNGGATAASAIAAQQEAAGRSSRDSNQASYRAFSRLISMCIERIRQFYDMPRMFRILGADGEEEFVAYDNSGIAPISQGTDYGVDMGYRLPVFDIEISAEKDSPYVRASNNDLALQLYGAGFFNPQNADMAAACLEMMEFKKRDDVLRMVRRNGGLMQELQLYKQMAITLAKKFAPEMVMGLMGNGGGAPIGGGLSAPSTGALSEMASMSLGTREHANVAQARERANNVIMPA